MTSKEMAEILIAKLTKDELHELITMYDNGQFGKGNWWEIENDDEPGTVAGHLFEWDQKNFPDEYCSDLEKEIKQG